MGLFGRYLSLWVGLSIVGGVALGALFPQAFAFVAQAEFARVNIVVAIFIWVMIFPMMVQVDLGCLKDVRRRPGGLALTLVINWLVKPFTMAALAWLFFRGLFVDLVSIDDANQYIAGMILLGVAPCTAMVFVWSQLSRGDPNYTLVQVSVNDLIMVFAFAPIAGMLLGVSEVIVPWDTLTLSVGLFVVIPLVAGAITRALLLRRGEGALDRFNDRLKPASILGLLATVVLIFGLQAPTILARPGVIVLIAAPLLVQSYGIFAITYGLAWAFRLRHDVAAPAAMIGTSNFFELAVAVAISLFGLQSGAALATVVGVLIEVPVMLSLVAIANRSRGAFEARAATA
ncbi:MAG: ACR3 family arsenite efflux transporter [Deltaproteobacteria bacterium]|nr:ACR3 family arsenite efflux transporter [Deltaproteobacteria bacterium]